MTTFRLPLLCIIPLIAMLVLAGCSQESGDPVQPNNPSESVPSSNPAPDSNNPPATKSPNTVPPDSSSPTTDTGTGAGTTKPAQPTPPAAAVRMDNITAVRLADPKSGWIGGEGWIARTDDGGKTWSTQYSGGGGTVSQLFALNGQEAWATLGGADAAAGAQTARKLLRTQDGGKTWTEAGTVPNAGFLHFVSKDEAYSANAKTTDGGKTWTALSVPEQVVGDAYFHDALNGWAAAQEKDMIKVIRTTDGGKTWQSVMSKRTVAQLTGTLIRSAGANDAWVELIGESGMTQTSYSLFHTTDGGQSWQTVIANSTAGGGPAPSFPIDHSDGPENAGSKPGALYVVDPNVAFMGGQCPACDKPNTIGWTTDGGKTWTNGEAAFPGYGEQLLAIADAKHGWWICTDRVEAAVMYTTADSGKSWQTAHTFEKPAPAS